MRPTLQVRDAWTFADLETLELDDWRRYEIIDGALLVSPMAAIRHEYVSSELRRLLYETVSGDFFVWGPIGIGMQRTYLIPDLLVVPRDRYRDAALLEPDDVALVVEVVSPGSVTLDRVTKPAQYASVRIPNYWRVETDPVSVTAYALPAGSDVYAEVGSWGVGETAELTDPFPVRIEVARLQPPVSR